MNKMIEAIKNKFVIMLLTVAFPVAYFYIYRGCLSSKIITELNTRTTRILDILIPVIYYLLITIIFILEKKSRHIFLYFVNYIVYVLLISLYLYVLYNIPPN